MFARWSVHSKILPYIEQDNLYRNIDFTFPPETPGMGGVFPFMPPWQNPNRENAAPCRTQVSIFLCPSDPTDIDADWPGANNYFANQQTWLCDLSEKNPSTIAPAEVAAGVFYYLSKVRLTDMTDGTSNTAIFSEKLRGGGFPNPRSDMFMMMNTSSLDDTYQSCTNLDPAMAVPLTSKEGASWVMGEMCCTTYNHVSPPNTRTCAGMGFSGKHGQHGYASAPIQRSPGVC